MAMLEHVPDLTLAFLNEATFAWLEHEYNRKIHSELGVAPITRFLEGRSVLRAPAPTAARCALPSPGPTAAYRGRATAPSCSRVVASRWRTATAT
jgi:hypothetical protein